MEATYQVDHNNLMRDGDILLAINSRYQDPTSDQNTIAEITWFGTDREMFLEVHIESFSPELMISHPEKYGFMKIWSVPYSWDHFDDRPNRVEALKEVQKEGRRIYFTLRRETKIRLKRNPSQEWDRVFSGQSQMEGSSDYGAFQESSQYPTRRKV